MRDPNIIRSGTFNIYNNWSKIKNNPARVPSITVEYEQQRGKTGESLWYAFFTNENGWNGELHGLAAELAYNSTNACGLLINCGDFMGGDCSTQLLDAYTAKYPNANWLMQRTNGLSASDLQAMGVARVENVPPKPTIVQSMVWQNQSGSRSTAPKLSAITSFTMQDSKPKLNGG